MASVGETKVRGIRGAVSVSENSAAAVKEATRDLLEKIVTVNALSLEDIACVFFTVTPDLNAAFPAAAARELGWKDVPLLCATEIGVSGSLPRTIRVLFLVNTSRSQAEIQHVYLGAAQSLRPDLSFEEGPPGYR